MLDALVNRYQDLEFRLSYREQVAVLFPGLLPAPQ
jgi:hypothetical protein